MKKDPIKIGIVGLGRAGWNMHCHELKSKEDLFKIVAVADTIEERRNLAIQTYKCKAYKTIDELIEDKNVELVDIANRSTEHFSDSIKSLKKGKYVFVEKPMCLTYNEAKKMEKESKGKLFVRHNRRFDPDFLHIKEIIKSGILGNIFQIKLTRTSYQRRDDWQTLKSYGGGQLLNWGPHIIDHALQFLNSPIENIWSDLKKIVAAGDAEDYVKIVLKGKNGLIVDVEINGGSAISFPIYVVLGTKGGLKSDGNTIDLIYIAPDVKLKIKKAKENTPELLSGPTEQLIWKKETIPVCPKKNYDIWNELFHSIRLGTDFPIKIEEAVEVMRIISKIKSKGPEK